VKCGRSSEASYGITTLTDVVLDASGELLPALGNSMELRYEAIGDSITAGFKVTGTASEAATPQNEDVFQTYVRHLADAWGTSDWRVVAKSGISILPYGSGSEKVMAQEWPCREFWAEWQGACPVQWDFSVWQADVVTINLGTNDFAFGDMSTVTKSNVQAGYKELLALVRQKYPQALILCIQPLQYSCGGGSQKLQNIVDGLEAAVSDMRQSGDDKVRYHTSGTVQSQWLHCQQHYSDYTHPTVEGNAIYAQKLLGTLTDDVRLFFPEKCSGTGPTCSVSIPAPTPVPTPVPFPAAPTLVTTQSTTTSSLSTTAPGSGSSGDAVCVAKPQSSLPDGTWATSDSYCSKCSTGYQWWPCDTDPSLCDCSTTTSATVPANLPASTTSASSTQSPGSVPVGSLTCTATLQSSLPSGTWATTDEYCAKCESGYLWWPCDTNPSLCQCI